MCILCQSIVRSEAVWKIHLNAKQHKQNVEQAKALKEKTNNFTTAKRALSPTPEVNNKKVKGILKNTGNITRVIAPSNITVIENDQKIEEKHKNLHPGNERTNTHPDGEELPEDFFDSGPSSTKKAKKYKQNTNNTQNIEEMDVDEVPTEQIPEGFFDDPKLDAKVFTYIKTKYKINRINIFRQEILNLKIP